MVRIKTVLQFKFWYFVSDLEHYDEKEENRYVIFYYSGIYARKIRKPNCVWEIWIEQTK